MIEVYSFIWIIMFSHRTLFEIGFSKFLYIYNDFLYFGSRIG